MQAVAAELSGCAGRDFCGLATTPPLPDYLRGVLVLAKAEKNRLSQAIISRPLGKLHLANHLWFHPVAVFHFCSSDALTPLVPTRNRQICKRPRGAGNFFKLRMQSAQEIVVKTSPHLSGEKQFLFFIESNNDETETLATAFRFEIYTHHQLL